MEIVKLFDGGVLAIFSKEEAHYFCRVLGAHNLRKDIVPPCHREGRTTVDEAAGGRWFHELWDKMDDIEKGKIEKAEFSLSTA